MPSSNILKHTRYQRLWRHWALKGKGTTNVEDIIFACHLLDPDYDLLEPGEDRIDNVKRKELRQ